MTMNNQGKEDLQISAGIDQPTLERLAHLFGICLYKLNLDTRDISLTLNTTRITGHDMDSLPNNDDTKESMIYAEDRDLVNRSISSIISGQRDHYHIEYRMYRRDSSIVWIEEVGLISEYDKDGHPLYMSAIAADMSRLKWAEEKARAMKTPIIAMTANAFQEDIYICIRAGMTGHIAKPFAVETLFEILGKYLTKEP